MKEAALPLGARVEARRINRETVRAVIAAGPIEHLKHIGEFYLIGKEAQSEPKRARHPGPKSRKELNEEARTGILGMYERGELKCLGRERENGTPDW